MKPEKVEIEKIVRKREQIDLSSYTFGKIPPQAKEVEEVVLGAMMLEKDAVAAAIQLLKPEMFYVNSHQLIFSAIVRLFAANSPVDILTVIEDLKKTGSLEAAGGPFAITELTGRVASGANIVAHAMIVKEKWISREVIRVSSMAIREAYEETSDPLECLGDAVNSFSTVLNEVAAGQSKSFASTVDEAFKKVADAIQNTENNRTTIGLSSGNYMLDRKSLGYSPSNLIIVAGRNTDGKTSLAAIAGPLRNAANGIPVGIFTLEMTKVELVQKMIAHESGVDVAKIRSGILTADEQYLVGQQHDILRSLPIQMYDKGGLSLVELGAVAKGWKAKYGTRYFVIDYLQLMKLGVQHRLSREQEVSEISRGLKALAKDLDSPIVAISALSRKLKDRAGWSKRPNDADLREGGSIEYDADIIIYVFRPENHDLESFEDGGSTKNAIELIISKNKLGYRGIIRQSINNGSGRLYDYSDQGYLEQQPLTPGKRPLRDYTSPKEKEEETPF